VLTGTACATVQVQQSSLVPAPVAPPPATDRGLVDAYVGDATVTFVSRPKRAPNDDSGLWIARHVLQGAITVHVSPLLGLRVSGFEGLRSGAMQAAPTSVRRPDQDVRGFAVGGVVNAAAGDHAFVATMDFGAIAVPSYVECRGEDCGFVDAEQSDIVMTAVASAGYAVRVSGGVRPQLSLTLQNHPSNDESFAAWAPDAEVQHGPLYGTVALLVEVQPLEWLAIAPAVQWPLTRSPIVYGPIIGFGVRGILPVEREP
jgi:hypothetical protein